MKQCETMKTLWKEYCLKSSIHGLRYIVESGRSIFERVTWIFLTSVAMCFVMYHLWVSWNTFTTAPTQIIVEDPRYPLHRVDFPAVTVCPINKVMYSKAMALLKEISMENENITEESYLNTLLVLSMTRYPFYDHPLEFIRIQRRELYFIHNEDISDIMLKIMPSVDDVFDRCFWRGTSYNCSELVRLQRTEEGFCYSFNSKTAESFTFTNKSSVTPPIDRVPLRNNAAGKITGFEFMLNPLDHEYLPKDGRTRGYNVVIHNPDDFPDVSKNYVVFENNHKVFRILVSPSIVVADDSILTLNKGKRRCFTEDDNELKSFLHFPHYVANTETNCYMLCRLRAIYETCNCTPYFFPPSLRGVQYCGMQHIHCLGIINVLQRNYPVPEVSPGFPSWSLPMFMNCTCIQACSFITYTTEIRRTFSDLLYTRNNFTMYVDVIYKELFAVRYRRFVTYRVQDLLVSFGGVASLFLGCSILSIAEFVYYAGQNVACIIREKCRRDGKTTIYPTSHTEPYRVATVKGRTRKLKSLAKKTRNKIDINNMYPYLP